jgi:hypothetical protein
LTHALLTGVLLFSANVWCWQAQPSAESPDLASSSPAAVNVADKLAPYQRYTHSRLIGWTQEGSAIIQTSGADQSRSLPVQLVSQPGQAPKFLVDAPASLTAARVVDAVAGKWMVEVGGGGETRSALTVNAGHPESIAPILFASNIEGIALARSKPLLATATIGSNNSPVLTLLNMQTQTRTRLNALKRNASVRDLVFSPDDRRLAFVAVERGVTSLWVVDVESGRSRRVPTNMSSHVDFRRPQFSAVGDQLITEVTLDGVVRLMVVDIRSGKTTMLTPRLKSDVREFAVSGGPIVALTTFESGTSILRFFDLKTNNELPRPALLKGEIRNLKWKADAQGVLGFNLSSLRSPTEVYTYDLSSTKLSRWTNGAPSGLPLFGLPEPEWVAWQQTPSPAYLQLWRPDEKLFPAKRPVVLLFKEGGRPTWPAGYLDRDTYLLAEAGVALVALVEPAISCQPSAEDHGRLAASLTGVVAWIRQQPYLDGDKIVLDCPSATGQHLPVVRSHATNFLGVVEYPANGGGNADAASRIQQVLRFINSPQAR